MMENKSAKVLKAREYFLGGYNCAQSVFAAFHEDIGMDEETALKASCGLGGGIGRLREVCGAVCGAAMLCGFTEDATNKTDVYKKVQDIAEEFKKQNDTYICRELLELKKGAPTPHTPDKRTAEYYKSRPCLKLVEDVTEIVENMLFTK